jgi:hypothetical protein
MSSPRVHVLKVGPPYFAAVDEGRKTFEIRRDDRDYRVGDLLLLSEYLADWDEYTGRTCERRVTYVLPGGQFGLADDYVCMALVAEPPRTAARAMVATARRPEPS